MQSILCNGLDSFSSQSLIKQKTTVAKWLHHYMTTIKILDLHAHFFTRMKNEGAQFLKHKLNYCQTIGMSSINKILNIASSKSLNIYKTHNGFGEDYAKAIKRWNT
jgi:hypothetical protein